MTWDDYDVFCYVIEHGGFSSAARAIDRPKSTVSASVERLEATLGARLLERTTRQVRPTEAGETLYHGIGPLFTALREARTDALAQGDSVAGMLRVAAPYLFGSLHLGPVACKLMERYPLLKVRIDVEQEKFSPLEGRYDIVFAVPESPLPTSTLVVRRMFSIERGLFASPERLQRQGEPHTPQDLATWPYLCGASDTEWTFTAPNGATETVSTLSPRLISDNSDVRLLAALAGHGVARIGATFCEAAVREGRLTRLLPDHVTTPLRVYALLPGKRLMPMKVRVLLDALGARADVTV